MIQKLYYIQNSPELDEASEQIIDGFPCWFFREPIEMDYSLVEVLAREEDVSAIEDILAPLV